VTALYVGLAIIGFMAFLAMRPKVKALISMFLMMQFFDMAPNLVYVWDYGAILMLVTAVEVAFRKPVLESPKHGYLVVLRVFLAWLLICFLWSVLVYRYPILNTIKNGRYVVLGYFLTLVFIRLFSVQPGSFEFLMKWFYWLTFALMPAVLLQYVLHKPLLFGLASDYEGVLRYIPIFLPLCLLNLWIIGAKALSSEKVALHEYTYLALVLVTVALTFTRGLYITVVITACMLVCTMFWDRTLKASSVVMVAGAGMLLVVGLLASGVADKVVGRALGGLDLVNSQDSSSRVSKKDDTFNGRLGLAAERFSLVWAENPLVGYGFLHEDDVPSDLRRGLKYGTPLGGTAADPTAYSRGYELSGHFILGLYTSDIGWADIVISTGWVGVVLLIAVILTLLYGYYRRRGDIHPMGYAVGIGFMLQTIQMFLLMFDGSYFYSNVQIPAFLLAGYSLTGGRRAASSSRAARVRPANLMT
jgi:O-Antigen ligase